MKDIFCIYPSIEGYLGCFQLLAISNKVAMKMVEQVSLWYCGGSLGYVPKSIIAKSSGVSISSFLWNLQIDFQSGRSG